MFVSDFEKKSRVWERNWERRHPRGIDPEKAAMYERMCEQVAELAEMADEVANSESGIVAHESAERIARWGR